MFSLVNSIMVNIMNPIEDKLGKYFIRFRQREDELKDSYKVIYAPNWEHARRIADTDFKDEWSMVYAENQWYNHEGKTQAQRFNLKEIV